MWAYRLFSTAMSQIGKPISRLEDIAQYLQPADRPANRPDLARPSPPAASAQPRPVYVGAPVAVDHDHMIFDTTPRLTSQLDFAPDRLGYLVNDEGLVLMGRSDDETPARGLRLAPIRLVEGPIMPARRTSAIRYKANLPRTPAVEADAAEVDADPEVLADQALAGGEIRIFDTRGREIIVRLRWAKLGNDKWRLLYRIMGDAMTIRAAARGWQYIGQDFAFDASGRLADMSSVQLDLGRGLEPVSIEFGRCGLTQFPDGTGLVKVLACSQNGWSKAALREVALREDGRVLGCFDNGRVALLGIAAFAEPAPCHDLQQAA